MPTQKLDAVISGDIAGKKFPPNSIVERILGIEQVLDPISGEVVEVAAKKKCIPTDASGNLLLQKAWDADWLPADENHAVMKKYAADAVRATKAAHRKERENLTAERDERAQKAADRKQKIADLESEVQVLRGQTITLENKVAELQSKLDAAPKTETPNV